MFQQEWIPLLNAPNPPPPPPAFVRLKGEGVRNGIITASLTVYFHVDMHKPEGHCDELTRCTSDVLEDNKPLQRMFVLAQKYQVTLRMRYLVPG